MMWVSFAMDGNRQEGKWLIVECKALKWTQMNSTPPKDTLTILHVKWDDCDITFTIMMIVKQRKLECFKMHKRRRWIVWCPHML